MRFVFVYTDSNAPAVASGTITQIVETTVNGVKQWAVTYASGATATFSAANGLPAILWEN